MEITNKVSAPPLARTRKSAGATVTAGVDFQEILNPKSLSTLFCAAAGVQPALVLDSRFLINQLRPPRSPSLLLPDGLLKTSQWLPFLPTGNCTKITYMDQSPTAVVVRCPFKMTSATLTRTGLSSLPLRSPPLHTGPRRRFESLALRASVYTGPAFVAVSARVLLPPSRPSSMIP